MAEPASYKLYIVSIKNNVLGRDFIPPYLVWANNEEDALHETDMCIQHKHVRPKGSFELRSVNVDFRFYDGKVSSRQLNVYKLSPYFRYHRRLIPSSVVVAPSERIAKQGYRKENWSKRGDYTEIRFSSWQFPADRILVAREHNEKTGTS